VQERERQTEREPEREGASERERERERNKYNVEREREKYKWQCPSHEKKILQIFFCFFSAHPFTPSAPFNNTKNNFSENQTLEV
jgi:hypothetical protein